MSFEVQVRLFGKGAIKRHKTIRDKVGLKLLSSVILNSPVDTGRFRANWITSIGAKAKVETITAEDKTGGPTIAKGKAAIDAAGAADTIHIINDLDYATTLELGLYQGVGKPDPKTGLTKTVDTGAGIFSRQATQGMMRTNVDRFQRLVDQAAKEGKLDKLG